MIRVSDLHKYYDSLHILKGISFSINEAEVVSVVGPSGAGKSTLLHILGTLDEGSNGKVYYNDEDVSAMTGKKLNLFRNRNIGFVFQFHHLLPEFSAVENVCLPGYIGGFDSKEVRIKAVELLEYLGLHQRLNHKPSELSGGEQQRVAVARALINQPQVILADEPSGNLDSDSAHELHHLFFSLREKFKQTFVIVTHNEQLAAMADRKLILKDGVLVS